jgi:NAD(P)-dependent dehydrogenase (short-subunit alcohol dehydrogenase family)
VSTPFSLVGHNALVTGGGSGIGYAIAECFTALGARVLIAGRTEARLAEAAQALGSAASYRVHDVSDTGAAAAFVASVEGSFGPIHTLVNNAGINDKVATLEASDDRFARVLQTNLVGAFALTREVARRMAERGRGDIQMITSMTAYFGLTGVAAYTASKAGLQGLVHQLSVELATDGIRVNGIAPGFIVTEMSRNAFDDDPERLNRVLARTPLGRRGDPADVGWAAAYLASPAAGFVSGTVLRVDGGAAVGF